MTSVEDRNAPSVMPTDGMLMIEAKPEGLLGLEETTVPLWWRGTGPPMEQWITSPTGRPWRTTLISSDTYRSQR